ncbi:hypothetical protein AHF37_06069 [Paragonimus kellicotti]|nr:hypothetical protein AHF37_06069 [Paragonimus kellicotti]
MFPPRYTLMRHIRPCFRSYSKKVKTAKGVAAVTKSKELPVETDTNKLVNFCCVNYKIGENPIPLRPDSEYPQWLWSLRTDRRPPPLDELDRNTYYFWRRVRRENVKHWKHLAALDGWPRKDHHSVEDHPTRFYGDWAIVANDWFHSQSLKCMK